MFFLFPAGAGTAIYKRDVNNVNPEAIFGESDPGIEPVYYLKKKLVWINAAPLCWAFLYFFLMHPNTNATQISNDS